MGHMSCAVLAVLELMLLSVISSSMPIAPAPAPSIMHCNGGSDDCSPVSAPAPEADGRLDSLPSTSRVMQPPKVKKFHVAVEGVIFCRGCKLPVYNHELNASPLSGAVAKLQCDVTNTSKPYHVNATTNSNGYFFLRASPRVSNLNVDKCKVFLVSSPMATCQKPSNYNKGVSGSPLKFEMKIVEGVRSAYNLYTTGILYFATTHHDSCLPYKTSHYLRDLDH